MTEVEFHTGLADPVGFACRLLRKALRKGARVTVCAPAHVLGEIDRELWTFDERDFLPHVRWAPSQPAHLLARTPVWLVDGEIPKGAPPILVNLGSPAPSPDAALVRLIELVGSDAAQESDARLRWREYKARGLNVVHHPAGA